MSKQQTPHFLSIPASEPPNHVSSVITLLFCSFLCIGWLLLSSLAILEVDIFVWSLRKTLVTVMTLSFFCLYNHQPEALRTALLHA